ncbi:MAG: glycosyl hydrolase [Anaerolineaceae bacterium]|nr:glycosyl hydrolase [Anaerolineaceae bacterium]
MIPQERLWRLYAWMSNLAILSLVILSTAQWRSQPRQTPGCQSASGLLTPTTNPASSTGSSIPRAESPIIPAVLTPLPRESWSSRAGFGLSTGADALQWAGYLGAGWYLNWGVVARPNQPLEHWQMVRLGVGCTVPPAQIIREIAHHYPGQVWIIGNEPDVVWQDNLTPEQYAQHYHDLYRLIKFSDPNAKIAVAGVAQGTPLRLAYIDRVLAAYRSNFRGEMPVDVWTVHGFVLREQANSWGVSIPAGMQTDAVQGKLYEVADHGRQDLFQAQIRAFRDWMAARGYRERPLALTEFGILMPAQYGFPPEVVGEYLKATFRWLEQTNDPDSGYPADGNRLVQRWAWFSLADPLYPDPNLADLPNARLTSIGEVFRAYVSGK